MRTLAKFSIKGYLPRLAAAFFVVWFAFVIQHLWLYIDDYIGKGLEPWIIFKSLGLQTLTIVPIALPTGILFSSILYFGDLGEHAELTALKSSGISLVKFLKPLVMLVIFIMIGSFFFNDQVIPKAQIKAVKIYYEVSNKKPALNIKAGEFYSEIPKHIIYVKKKDADNSTIHGVKIYDNSDGYEQQKVILADKGKMYVTDDNTALVFELFNGWRYGETYDPQTEANKQIRLGFQYYKKVFDLKEFDLEQTSEDYFKNLRKAMSISRITKEIDTARQKLDKSGAYISQILTSYISSSDSGLAPLKTKALPIKKLINNDSLYNRAVVMAEVNARSVKNSIEINIQNKKLQLKNLVEHKIEWHRRFTIPFACLILFIIGASLGGIMRKGGFGVPFIVAVVFFVILYILNTIGEKMASNQVVDVWLGMWMSSILLSIIAIMLLVKANSDAPVLNKEWYFRTWKKAEQLFRNTKAS